MESFTNIERRRIRGRRSNRVQIPAFGEWNFIQHQQDSVPITHYFDCYTKTTTPSASLYPYPIYGYYDVAAVHDDLLHGQHLYTSPQQQKHYLNNTQLQLHSPSLNMRQVKGECGTRRRQQRRSRIENRKRVFHVTSTDIDCTNATLYTNGTVSAAATIADVTKFHNMKTSSNANAKDEDLYKIPPELISKSMPKKKMSKFLHKYFVTICA